jgi:predicted peroxiredoxin
MARERNHGRRGRRRILTCLRLVARRLDERGKVRPDLAFMTAVGAIGAAKEVTLGLVGESAHPAKKAVAKSVHGVGLQPLSELIDKVVQAKIAFDVRGASSVARGVTERDLETLKATFMDPINSATLVSGWSMVRFWSRGRGERQSPLRAADRERRARTARGTWCTRESRQSFVSASVPGSPSTVVAPLGSIPAR